MLAQEGHGRQVRVPGGHDGSHCGVELSGESNQQEKHKRVSEAPSFPPSLAGQDASPDLGQMSCNMIYPVCHDNETRTMDTVGVMALSPAETRACQTLTHLLLNLRRRSVRSSRMRSMLAREIR